MRAILFTLVLIAAISVVGCSSDQQGRAKPPTNGASETLTGDFYKRFEGTIDGKPVVMHLHRMGKYVGGSYYYVVAGVPIGLISLRDSATGSTLDLTEYDASAPVSDNNLYPRLQLLLKGNSADGKWISGDSMQIANIALREEYPAGSVRLAVAQFHDSTRMFTTKDRPLAKASFGTVTTASKGASERWLDAQIRKVFGEAAVISSSWAQALKTVADDYFADYRSAAIAIDSSDSIALNSSMHSYNTQGRVLVMMNDKGWLILESKRSDYTGGAHDNHGVSFLNLDWKQQRVWKLTDIVTDTAALVPFLVSAVLTRFSLSPGESLSTRLLVDNIPVTDNFYLTTTGMGFVYNPYEIAPYADGEVHLFIPYKRLMLLLTDDFKQRMGLSNNAVMRG